MSSSSSCQAGRKLKEYVTNILNHDDLRMEFIYQDCEHLMQESNNNNICKIEKIEKMDFTLDTLASSLQTIADHMFIPGEAYKSYYVVSLFLYCMKLDEYFKKNLKDYKTDLLVDVLVNILIKIDYNIPKPYYCSIL